ncbi:sirohydrochlorin chelatase [Paludisphaera mucosa]|uniref:CbiX/SirB N-terminal domain-containing protein n=1 Tax=Paludisphaera mucosa TaxID=3030827 RepID=A0ABT6F7A0_9BACT|nr:CbiX/SirB N-terminal domain-containing protein [Paludisphaera mucosa]MDG3003404.1 CbiX/SirB N-terminal domain-containing protein [Paludisphaera mucosa]
MNDPRDTTAVLLIAHGSRREEANADLRDLAERLAAGGRHCIVEACFLELAEPDISSGGARCVARGAMRVFLIPYFLSAGVHLLRDLTAARDDLASRHPGIVFVLGPPLGPHPLLDLLVDARVQELWSGVGAVEVASAEAADRFRPMENWAGRARSGGQGVRREAAERLDENSGKG